MAEREGRPRKTITQLEMPKMSKLMAQPRREYEELEFLLRGLSGGGGDITKT
jgi:hypothetical protein